LVRAQNRNDLLFRKPATLHRPSLQQGRTLILRGGKTQWQVNDHAHVRVRSTLPGTAQRHRLASDGLTAFPHAWLSMLVSFRLDPSWPAGNLYCMLLRRVAFPDFCKPCLPRFVLGMAVVATLLVTAPAVHAVCRSPKNICKHFDDCLQRTSDPNNKDADGIRAGVKARNGQIVLAGAEACARDLGRKQQWDKWARGCSELEFVQIAKVGVELGKVHCDRYSQ